MKLESLHADIRYPAILLDKDDQHLATGEVQIDTFQARGVFSCSEHESAAILSQLPIDEANVEILQSDLRLKAYHLKSFSSQTVFHFDLSQ